MLEFESLSSTFLSCKNGILELQMRKWLNTFLLNLIIFFIGKGFSLQNYGIKSPPKNEELKPVTFPIKLKMNRKVVVNVIKLVIPGKCIA